MLGGLVLGVFILALGNVSSDVAVAQAKKDDKAGKVKKDAGKAKADTKAGVIEIAQGKDDKFRFFVRDGDGKLLAMSGPGGFATAKDAEAAVEQLKAVVEKAKVSVVEK
jgi:hypothetical protein